MVKSIIFLLSLVHAMAFSAKPPEKESKLFKLALGAKTFSNLSRRGAMLYDSYQIYPVIYAAFFDERLRVVGTNIEYADFIYDKKLRGRSKIEYLRDRPWYTTAGVPLTFRNTREDTFEWAQTIELFVPSYDDNKYEFVMRYAQDLKAHKGAYFELSPSMTLYNWYPDKKAADRPVVQVQAFGTFGWGTVGHNLYLYGTGADEAGFTHGEVGIQIVSPVYVDIAYPVFQLFGYQILRPTNQKGALAKDQISGVQVNFMLAWGVI